MNAMPPMLVRPAAVFFDMDGLLLDSEAALLACWCEAAMAMQVHADDALWLSMVGLSDAVCNELLARQLGEARALQLRARCQALYDLRVVRGIPVKAGALELLALLQTRGVPRAVVTSTWRERAIEKLTAAGLLPHFDDVVGGRDVARPKPAPDPYLLAAERLRVPAQRCVVLEDSIAGVTAGLAAGMQVIQVPDLVASEPRAVGAGYRTVPTLRHAQTLIEAALMP